MVNKIEITQDGNCFYRCISEFLYDTEDKYNLIRMAIYTYAISNINEITQFQPTVEIKRNRFIDTKTYIINMNQNKFWAGDIEMNIACYIFGISIILYKSITNEFIFEDYHEYIYAINLSEI